MNIPKKFTFFNGNNNLLKLTNINGDYYCTLPNVEANPIHSAVYDRMNVEHKLHTGKWKIVADLSVPEKEPEMVLPITIKTLINGEWVSYYIEEDSRNKDKVFMTSLFGIADNWKSFVKQCIKEGIWIVQSVGEQQTKDEIVEPVQDYGLSYEKYDGPAEDLVEVRDGAATAEKITVGSLSSLSVKVDIANFEESFAKLTSFHEKVELTIKAVEKLSELLESLGIGGNVMTYEIHNGPMEDLFEIRDGKPFCCGGV